MRVKSEERRQAILSTAKEEFTTNGFSQTSMSTIAKKVGGSKATLYNYFSSKEEIFTEVMESVAQQLVSAFHDLSIDGDIKNTLTQFGFHYLTSIYTPELVAVTKIAYTEAERSELGRYFYENGPKKGWDNIDSFLSKHIEQGNIRRCDTWIAAMQLKALLEAELREPYVLGVIPQPDKKSIDVAVERAIESFLILYGNNP